MQDIDTLLTAQDVADLLKIDVSTLYRWVADGQFPPPLKISPLSRRWRLTDVRAAVDAMPRREIKTKEKKNG